MGDKHWNYVYMMCSASRRALYTGFTGDLPKRVWEHKNHLREGFSDEYNCTKLVYFETFVDPSNAIAREKQVKRWRREKKVALIESTNPTRRDLSEEWFETQGSSLRSG